MRIVLKSDFKNAKECLKMIESLHDEFLRIKNRNSNIDLFYCAGGTEKKPIIELTAHFENKDMEDLELIKKMIEQL